LSTQPSMTSRLWSNPNARAALKTLTWFPVIFFFLENGYSTATVQGRSMQVPPTACAMQRNMLSFQSTKLTTWPTAHFQSRFKSTYSRYCSVEPLGCYWP
jgi:hypothetical protein